MKPTVDQVKAGLRIDGTHLDSEIAALVDQVHDEMLAKLDRMVYASAAALTAANDPTGLVFTADMIRAQILLIGYHLEQAGSEDGERARAAAMQMLDRHRRMGV